MNTRLAVEPFRESPGGLASQCSGARVSTPRPSSFSPTRIRQLGREAEAAAGVHKQALDLIEQRARLDLGPSDHSPTTGAAVLVVQGRHDEAMEKLRTAIDDGWMGYSSLEHTPHFGELRKRGRVPATDATDRDPTQHDAPQPNRWRHRRAVPPIDEQTVRITFERLTPSATVVSKT